VKTYTVLLRDRSYHEIKAMNENSAYNKALRRFGIHSVFAVWRTRSAPGVFKD
jgi:hypothetical protein